MSNHIILGVHITDRIKHVSEVQGLLSEYGCYIKTRLGLHDTSKESCSPSGLLLLEMLDEPAKVEELVSKLSKVEGIDLKRMTFTH